jgi:hypothetical protein
MGKNYLTNPKALNLDRSKKIKTWWYPNDFWRKIQKRM